MVGPTAVGKTAVSLRLALHYGSAIVSADSRQIFRELTIGTAKPSADELRQVKHYFIDSHAISETIDAAQFADATYATIQQLFHSSSHVVVCGGSGLYIRALLDGLDDIPEVPDQIREDILREYSTHGLTWLQQQLSESDLEAWETIDRQNPHRIIRALEVVRATGKSIRHFQTREKKQHPFEVIKIGLDLDREMLYQRIDLRMDQMIEQGLFEEAAALYPYRAHQALQTVGYQEIFGFIEGKYDREEAIRLLKRNSRRYAKRQLTWFKRDEDIRWFDPNQVQEIIRYIDAMPGQLKHL